MQVTNLRPCLRANSCPGQAAQAVSFATRNASLTVGRLREFIFALTLNTDREKQLPDLNGCIDEVMKIIVGELAGKKFAEPKDRKAVAVDPKIYDSNAGRYEIEPGVVLTVRREGERLMVQVNGQAAAEVFPASETEYFSRRIDVQIKLVKNLQGQVTSLIIVQNGRNILAKRIK
jgi:hypothetical protein